MPAFITLTALSRQASVCGEQAFSGGDFKGVAAYPKTGFTASPAFVYTGPRNIGMLGNPKGSDKDKLFIFQVFSSKLFGKTGR